MHHGNFADDTKKGEGITDVSAATENDLGSLDKGLDRNFMKFNKGKCKLRTCITAPGR